MIAGIVLILMIVIWYLYYSKLCDAAMKQRTEDLNYLAETQQIDEESDIVEIEPVSNK